MNKLNKRRKQFFLTFEFPTLYTKLSHYKVAKVLIINLIDYFLMRENDPRIIDW